MADNPHIEKTRDDAVFKKTAIRNYLHSYSAITNPVTSAKLQEVFHVSDVVIRQAIGLLRDDGEPIGSGPKGFFYAKRPDQLKGTLDDFRSRIRALSARLRRLEATYERLGGNTPQQTLIFTHLD